MTHLEIQWGLDDSSSGADIAVASKKHLIHKRSLRFLQLINIIQLQMFHSSNTIKIHEVKTYNSDVATMMSPESFNVNCLFMYDSST